MDPALTTPAGSLGAPVVVIGGAPGSGKSTIGAALARRVGAALLDQDTVTNPLIAQIALLTGTGDDLDHPSLRGSVREARYACLRDAAAEVSALGCPVVVVAPFTAELQDAVAWHRFSSSFGSSVLVAVTIDPAESLRRRRSRGAPRDRTLVDPVPVTAELVAGTHVDLVLDGAGEPLTLVAEILPVAGLSVR